MDNIILLCENNLVGFLSAVYHAYYTYPGAGRITARADSVTLFDTPVEIAADLDLAARVRQGIIKKSSKVMYKEVIDAYLNANPDKEQHLFAYLKLLFKHGRTVQDMYGEPVVMKFGDLLRQVRGERHRLEGFIRLQEMENGAYYGFFASDHDILELLMPEFLPQFNTQQLILHDIRRKKLIYYDGRTCHKLLAPDGVDIVLSDEEAAFQKLWKTYFNAVNIESRKNLRLQRGFLPKKYRFFMHEF